MEWLDKALEGIENAEEIKKAIAKGIGENFVSKSDFNAVNEAKKQLESDIIERDEQLERLKEIDAEGLQSEIARLQEENKKAKETYENELKELQLTNAIKLSIAGKVHDEELVSGLLDKSKLVIADDGKVVGLNEQIESLRESKGFLFKQDESTDEPEPGFKKIGNPQPGDSQATDSAIAAAFGNLKE